MHLLFDTALMAPVRGWLARAERLLEGQGETPVHAWLAVVRSYERMLTGDLPGARQWARRAIEVGAKCDPAACAIGRVAEARLLILDGDVGEGLALLDEAGVAAVSGELDPLSTGIVYCELVCALQGLAQYDLAEEWTEAMERWCDTNAIGSLHGRCRVHRAEILRLRGSCHEAESRSAPGLRGTAPLPAPRARLATDRARTHPTAQGRHRRRGGGLAGRARRRLGSATRPRAGAPGPGRRVDGGRIHPRRARANPLRVPSKELPPNTDLRRAPLLEAQVEIEIAAGDIVRARSAADELQRVAARFESKALTAGAALAHGRVRLAAGDAARRRTVPFRRRATLERGRRPVRGGARPHAPSPRRSAPAAAEHRAALELQAARTVLETGSDDRQPPDRRASHRPAANVFRREGDYWSVVFEGHTVRVRDLQGHAIPRASARRPRREFHVLDLVAAEAESSPPRGNARRDRPVHPHSATPARCSTHEPRRRTDGDSPRSTRTSSRRRQATTSNGPPRPTAERDFLVRELSRAVGLGGRDRRAGSASERARASVTRALRQAMARIGEHHPQLGEHLDRTIRTGTYCSYLPDPHTPARWDL